MGGFFLELVNRSLAAGWLVLAVVLLRVLLKKAPKWVHCVLWALVGVRLTCPFTFESVLSLLPSAKLIHTEVYEMRPYIETGLPAVDATANDFLGHRYAEGVTVPAKLFSHVTEILFAVWAVGLLVLLLYAGISYFRLRKTTAASMPTEPQVYVCDAVSSPFILGVLKPRIFLPSDLPQAQMPLVLAHEKAHLKRYDHLWKPLGFLVLAVYWFNPLCWLSYILLCRDIELACDERVIKELDANSKRAYSEALLSCSTQHRRIAACPLAFGETGVKTRIKNILNYKKPAFWVILLAVAVCIATSVCLLTNPKNSVLNLNTTVYGKSYAETAVVYDCGMYSFARKPINAPQYCIGTDDKLYCAENGVWQEAGALEKTQLTFENFDKQFINGDAVWDDSVSCFNLRRENRKAWRMASGGESYLFLLQQNGDVYMAYGYAENPHIRWIFKLREIEFTESADTAVLNGEAYVQSDHDWYPFGTPIEMDGYTLYQNDAECRFLRVESGLFSEGVLYHKAAEAYPDILNGAAASKATVDSHGKTVNLPPEAAAALQKLLTTATEADITEARLGGADGYINLYYAGYPAYQSTWMLCRDQNGDTGLMYSETARNTAMLGENQCIRIPKDGPTAILHSEFFYA